MHPHQTGVGVKGIPVASARSFDPLVQRIRPTNLTPNEKDNKHPWWCQAEFVVVLL